LNNTNELVGRALLAHRKTPIPDEQSSSTLQWPFTERRKGGDRRVGDRRKGERRQGERRQGAARATREATPSFTGREREIVDLLMKGMTNRQIARALGMAEATVKKHLHHVFKKLGVHSRALLILRQSSKKR
jgi:DNA-binding CsgD family transcriptional regulator